jgi:hypothetical protein
MCRNCKHIFRACFHPKLACPLCKCTVVAKRVAR